MHDEFAMLVTVVGHPSDNTEYVQAEQHTSFPPYQLQRRGPAQQRSEGAWEARGPGHDGRSIMTCVNNSTRAPVLVRKDLGRLLRSKRWTMKRRDRVRSV